MSHHDTVQRVPVKGPNGPILVHPDLVRDLPEHYVPVDTKPAQGPSVAKRDENKES